VEDGGGKQAKDKNSYKIEKHFWEINLCTFFSGQRSEIAFCAIALRCIATAN
jgi:hypothetical protein